MTTLNDKPLNLCLIKMALKVQYFTTQNNFTQLNFFFHTIHNSFHATLNLFHATLICFQYTLNQFNIWSVIYARMTSLLLVLYLYILFFYLFFIHSFLSLTLNFKNSYYTSEILTQPQDTKVSTQLVICLTSGF